MNKSALTLALVVAICFTACNTSNKQHKNTGQNTATEQTDFQDIPFTVAERYFSNVDTIDNPKIETEEKMKEIMGLAPVMGDNGRPTSIDFTKQYVIAVAKPATDVDTKLKPVSLKKNTNGNIEFTYKIEKVGERRSFDIKPFLAIIVDKTHEGKVVLIEDE